MLQLEICYVRGKPISDLSEIYGGEESEFRDNDGITKTFLVRVGMAFYFTHNQVLVLTHTYTHTHTRTPSRTKTERIICISKAMQNAINA